MTLSPTSSRGVTVVNPSANVNSVFTRTGAVVAVAGDYNGVVPAALTGATQASRYVGATTSGAPVSGTFAVGDLVIDQAGGAWTCTAAGTPGTWAPAVPAASVTNAHISTGAAIQQSKISGGAGYVLLSSTTNVGTANFDVSSISGSYTDLLIRCICRTASASASEFLLLQFNGDTGANYYRQSFESRATTNTGSESTPGTNIRVGEGVGNGATANRFSVVDIIVYGYASTSWHKSVFCHTFSPEGTATSTEDLMMTGGTWANTAAITRVVIQGTANGLVVGSTMRIYGIT